MPGTPEMGGIVPIADESLKPHGAISVVTHKYLHRAVPAGPGGGAEMTHLAGLFRDTGGQ